MSVAALALLPRRDAPYTPVWSTPFFRDTTLNTSVSYVKGRPQAAFFYERVRGREEPRRRAFRPPSTGRWWDKDEGSDNPLSEARRWIRVAQERRSSPRGGPCGAHHETSCG